MVFQSTSHPLDPLSPVELKAAADIIRDVHASSDARLWFKVSCLLFDTLPALRHAFFNGLTPRLPLAPAQFVTLREPPKKELVPFLLAERTSKPIAAPARVASALVAVKTAAKTTFIEYTVSLTESALLSSNELSDDHHAGIDGEEMLAAEAALLADATFLKAIEELRLPEGSVVVADPWIFGSDTRDSIERLIPYVAPLPRRRARHRVWG